MIRNWIDWGVQYDKLIFKYINLYGSNPLFDVIMPIFRDPISWVILYVFLLFLSIKKLGKKHTLIIIICSLVALGLSDALVANTIKHWVGRIRPCNNNELHVRLLLTHCGSGFSFISAHACNHATLGLFWFLVSENKINSPYFGLLIWPLLISFAQVYVGVHYPADVAVGYILGCLIAVIISKYLYIPLKNKYIF